MFHLDWASLPGARNYAVRRSSGEIILFIDDDVQLTPGFLAAHGKNYLQNPEVGAVAGRVFDRMKLGDSGGELEIEYLPPQAMDPGIAWYHIDLVHTIKPQQVLTARGCNMSFRREIFTKYGLRFDERFRGSAVREESDFCLRLRQTGYKIWYDPEAHLVHLGEETGGCHDISMRSLQYQLTFYHNHFLLGLKNLTATKLYAYTPVYLTVTFWDIHLVTKAVLQSKLSLAAFSTLWVSLKALGTVIQSIWNDGQIYSQLDQQV